MPEVNDDFIEITDDSGLKEASRSAVLYTYGAALYQLRPIAFPGFDASSLTST